MDSITSETIPDKNNSATNVLYEEEPCYIDEDDEKCSERICVIPEIEKDLQVKVQSEVNESPAPMKRDGSLYKRKYKNGSSTCENTCLLKPEQDNEVKTIAPTTSFLNVPKSGRPAHKMYGSTKHLFKQTAVDDGLEESSLLLPTTSFDPQANANSSFLRVDIPMEYKPAQLNKSSMQNMTDIQIQSSSETSPSTISLKDNCSISQISTPSIVTVTESEFGNPEMTEEESIRKVIAERRKIDMMKPDNLFASMPHSTTQVLIESCQSPKNEEPSRLKNDRHLSADRMSSANFSTSGESGEFLLGQRSSESYEETSEEQGNTNNSTSTAVVDKTNSINDGDDLDCLIIVCEDKDGVGAERKGEPSPS